MRDATRPMNRPLPPSHAIIAPPASGAFGFSAVQTLALKFLLPAAFPWTSPSEKLGIALPRMPTFRLPNFCAIYHPWALLKPPDRAWWLAGLGWVSPLPTDRQTRQPTSSPCTPHCSTSGIILYFFCTFATTKSPIVSTWLLFQSVDWQGCRTCPSVDRHFR